MNKLLKNGLKLSYLLILIIAFTGCTDVEPTLESKPVSSIYISGTTNTENSGYRATYWKDGVPQYLEEYSFGYGIDVSGPNVYVAGEYWSMPVYWKNDSIVHLPSDGMHGRAQDIHVYEGDIYVSGVILDGTGYYYAVYWKNGVINYLTEGSIYSGCSSIIVDNGNIHISGFVYKDGKGYVAYWKNGVLTTLGIGEPQSGTAYSLFVEDDDVYFSVVDFTSLPLVAQYWKNGSKILLSDGANSAEVRDVIVDNNDVYAIGITGGNHNGNGEVTFWKNNEILFLGQSDTKDVSPNSLAISEGNIYGVGSVLKFGGGGFSSNATLWVNGVPSILEGGKGEIGGSSWAFDIKVVSDQTLN